MSYLTTKDELAKIAIAKNLIKEYKSSNSERTVYLNDGTEFQIYLKNPYQTHLGIRIYVNNQSIGNMLVLKPGQSYWLDRFVNENKRFLFSTYEVENTAEMKYAINNNGKVRIEFYHEKEEKPYVAPMTVTWTGGPDYNYYSSSCSASTGSVNTVLNATDTLLDATYDVKSVPTSSCYYSSSASTIEPCSASIERSVDDSHTRSRKKGLAKESLSLETGRVEKGSRSNQEFEYCDINFDYYPFKTENIHILPSSQKKVNVEETRRRYCSQCGKKVSPKDKFCSNCGAKLT